MSFKKKRGMRLFKNASKKERKGGGGGEKVGVDEIIFWAWMNQLFCQQREKIQNGNNPREHMAATKENHLKMSTERWLHCLRSQKHVNLIKRKTWIRHGLLPGTVEKTSQR